MATAVKTFLYKRPKHSQLQLVQKDKDTGTLIQQGIQPVSAFAGIDAAVRGVSLGGGNLHESLRILRKLEKASHREFNLHPMYVEFTSAEKDIIVNSVNQFNWSKLCADIGHNLWTNWLDFLAGFVSDDELFAQTWIEYDPTNPPAEYAAWKIEYAEALAAYNKAVEEAEARAAATLAQTKPVVESAHVVEAASEAQA